MGTEFEGGSPQNYTVGGTRFIFNRLADESTSPVRYEGFRDMGNVVDSSQEQEIEELEHFSSKTGTRRRDRSLITEISEEIVLTLDELFADNLRTFFRGSDLLEIPGITSAPASWVTITAYARGAIVAPVTPNGFFYVALVGGTAAVGEPTWPTSLNSKIVDGTVTWQAINDITKENEIMQLIGDQERILGQGYNASSIVVKDIADVVTHILDTDYSIVEIIGGYKGIKAIPGNGIDDGDFVRVSYTFEQRAVRRVAPATELEVIGQAVFFGVSDTGNEFSRSFEKVQLEPEGAFEFDDEDWTTFQIRVKVQDNTDSIPDAPFGLLDHHGTGTDL